ncbi:MAG: M20 family metallopeptidase [Chloroflexaceae bacterium]|nr:M20 family metallopeptidase [Chloroflexaceae bacterium]
MTDRLRDELITLTTDLMRFRSTAAHPDQIMAAMDYAAAYLGDIPGIFIERVEHNGVPSLVATLHKTRAPALMLNGHLDVVAAPPELFEPTVHDGRIYGRGSQDMKGSVAAMLRLMKHLATLDPRPDVGLQLAGDEELGGPNGTRFMIEDDGWRCDFCITGEPTDMQICYEQKGAVWLEMELKGTPAHGSRPWDGHNPIFDYARGLLRLTEQFPPPTEEAWQTTITPTIVSSGGNSRNQIPPALRVTFDIRHTSDHSPDALVQTVQACFPTAEILVSKSGTGLVTDPHQAAVQRLAAVTAQLRGTPTAFYREHFGSDARFFTAQGMAAVCFGPHGQGLHSEEEWVEIDSLVEFYTILQAYVAGM